MDEQINSGNKDEDIGGGWGGQVCRRGSRANFLILSHDVAWNQYCLLLRNSWRKNAFNSALRSRGIAMNICYVFIVFQGHMPGALHELLKR